MSPEGPQAPEPPKSRSLFPLPAETVTASIQRIGENPMAVIEDASLGMGVTNRDLTNRLVGMHDVLAQERSAVQAGAFFNGGLLIYNVMEKAAEASGFPLPKVSVRGFRDQQRAQSGEMMDAGVTDPFEYARIQREKIAETDPEAAEVIGRITEIIGGMPDGDAAAARYGAVTTYLALRSEYDKPSSSEDSS
jgi:hypothetical protein